MTTIATDGWSVAVDTGMTNGSMKEQFDVRKFAIRKVLLPTEKDYLFFATGTFGLMHPFINWYLSGAKIKDIPTPVRDHNFGIELLIFENNSIACIGSDNPGRVPLNAPLALGSGHYYAITALLLGHSPAIAVAAAMKLDTGTFGKVLTLELPPHLRVLEKKPSYAPVPAALEDIKIEEIDYADY